MSHSVETHDESIRTPGLVATALEKLRLPLAIALLAYLALRFLLSFSRLVSGEAETTRLIVQDSFAQRTADEHVHYLGLFTLLLLALVVALVAVREPLKLARPLVLTTLVLTGIGLFLGVVGTLAFLFVDSIGSTQSTRDKFEATLLDLPVIALYVLFGLFLLGLLGPKGLPRPPKREPAQQQQQNYGQYSGPQQGGIPGFPPVEHQYGYQQPPQNQSYDPWQGYPQQGYQQQPYQPEPAYQQQPEQAPYQPPQWPGAHPSYQQAEQSHRPPDQAQQPSYRGPEQPAGQPGASRQGEQAEPVAETEPVQSPAAPYRSSFEPDRPNTAPPPPPPASWPQQPTQALPVPPGEQPPEGQQGPDQVQDWDQDGHRKDAPEPPPPYAGWSGPHL